VPIITSIKPQKNKKRVNIFLDSKFGFGLDLENYMKLGLKIEQRLTDAQVEDIVKKAEYQKTLDYLLRFATLRPRSEQEIHQWLKRKKVHESLHSKLIVKLRKFELLDDREFAKWWVGQRLQFRKKSKRELVFELRKKGIEKSLIDDILDEVKINEEGIAKKLIKNKAYRWDRLEDKIAKQKKTEYLARKGFPWEVIKKVLMKT